MKRLLPITLCAACATTSGATAPFQPDDVVEQTVLTGPEGIRVEVAQSQDRALLRITGVNNELEGLVLPAELAGDVSRRYYETVIDGRTSRTLHRIDQQWTLYARMGSGITLTPDPDGTVDTKALIKTHLEQKPALDELARFDVEGTKTRAKEGLAEEMASAIEACGISAEIDIDWSGITEAQLMKYSIPSYCSNPDWGLRRACKVEELKAHLSRITRYECAFGDGLGLEMDGTTLRYTVDFDTPNQSDWARDALDRLPLTEQRSIRDARIQAATHVCKDPKGERYVVLGPSESERFGGISYGDGRTQYRHPERRYLPEGWFFEPRFPNPQHNSSFRGYDLRVYSYLDPADEEDETPCKLSCGTREIALETVEGDAKRELLTRAEFVPLPDPRQPYGLARDRRGIYYYVDHGATPATAKDFRLYVGRPGRLKLQKMKDIVSDSEGEIFSSPTGSLKLYLGRDEAEWTVRGRTQKLLRVPIAENYDLIYGQLGVYLGVKLHTPCDDL